MVPQRDAILRSHATLRLITCCEQVGWRNLCRWSGSYEWGSTRLGQGCRSCYAALVYL